MTGIERDTAMRLAAFAHVGRLSAVSDLLTAGHLQGGFQFEGEHIPLVNTRSGIFKPQVMHSLLSIKTVFPKSGARV